MQNMYQTPLRKYLWQLQIKKAKMNKPLFRVHRIFVNQYEKFRSSIVRMRNLADWDIINDITKIDEINVICQFQFITKNLELEFTFVLIEMNFENVVTNIWSNINQIQKQWIKNYHNYWIIPIALFNIINIKINDRIFIK
ncbi:hypothetical protein MCAV_03670 [[Mycoplasma] cavipharyngis]|uniref:hypothetical protein n=1 Tax=[Mycoplasma] cavipharyngis TaxID=92757 RepID=UPI00370454F9